MLIISLTQSALIRALDLVVAKVTRSTKAGVDITGRPPRSPKMSRKSNPSQSCQLRHVSTASKESRPVPTVTEERGSGSGSSTLADFFSKDLEA